MSALKQKLKKDLDEMSDQDIRHLLEASKLKLESERKPMSGAEFVRQFVGLIPPDEMEAMERAIEEDCERIDADE
jgi:hypothetical protein